MNYNQEEKCLDILVPIALLVASTSLIFMLMCPGPWWFNAMSVFAMICALMSVYFKHRVACLTRQMAQYDAIKAGLKALIKDRKKI